MSNSLNEIFRAEDSKHSLALFEPARIEKLEKSLFEKNGRPFLKCLVRGKDIQAKPEEIVRQLWLLRLHEDYNNPIDRLRVEHPIQFGREVKKADIAVMDKDRPTVEFIIVEVKKIELKDGKKQLRSYCNATGAPVGVWSNGGAEEFYHRKDPNYFDKLIEIPKASQKLSEVIGEKLYLEDLARLDAEKSASLIWRTGGCLIQISTSWMKHLNTSRPSDAKVRKANTSRRVGLWICV